MCVCVLEDLNRVVVLILESPSRNALTRLCVCVCVCVCVFWTFQIVYYNRESPSLILILNLCWEKGWHTQSTNYDAATVELFKTYAVRVWADLVNLSKYKLEILRREQEHFQRECSSNQLVQSSVTTRLCPSYMNISRNTGKLVEKEKKDRWVSSDLSLDSLSLLILRRCDLTIRVVLDLHFVIVVRNLLMKWWSKINVKVHSWEWYPRYSSVDTGSDSLSPHSSLLPDIECYGFDYHLHTVESWHITSMLNRTFARYAAETILEQYQSGRMSRSSLGIGICSERRDVSYRGVAIEDVLPSFGSTRCFHIPYKSVLRYCRKPDEAESVITSAMSQSSRDALEILRLCKEYLPWLERKRKEERQRNKKRKRNEKRKRTRQRQRQRITNRFKEQINNQWQWQRNYKQRRRLSSITNKKQKKKKTQ